MTNRMKCENKTYAATLHKNGNEDRALIRSGAGKKSERCSGKIIARYCIKQANNRRSSIFFLRLTPVTSSGSVGTRANVATAVGALIQAAAHKSADALVAGIPNPCSFTSLNSPTSPTSGYLSLTGKQTVV